MSNEILFRENRGLEKCFPLEVGTIFKGTFQTWKILSYKDAASVEVECQEDGYTTVTSADSIRQGYVRNPFYPVQAGKGYLGLGDFSASEHLWAYKKWQRMLDRCYNEKRSTWKNYGGRGVIVEEAWHNFQNFAEWAIRQPFYGTLGYEMDKDLLSETDSPMYSRHTCCFVPRMLNNFLKEKTASRDLPKGVAKTFNKKNKFRARVSRFNKIVNIGVYSTVEEASEAYLKERAKYVKEVIEVYSDLISKEALARLRILYDVA